jgi:hypothetical protein
LRGKLSKKRVLNVFEHSIFHLGNILTINIIKFNLTVTANNDCLWCFFQSNNNRKDYQINLRWKTLPWLILQESVLWNIVRSFSYLIVGLNSPFVVDDGKSLIEAEEHPDKKAKTVQSDPNLNSILNQ